MQGYGYEPPTKSRKKWPWVVIGLLLALIVLGCSMLGAIMNGAGPSNNGIDTYATPSARPAPKAASGVKGNSLKVIGAGTWLVGQDVAAGKYRTSGAKDDLELCYWHTAPDDGTSHIREQGVIANPNEPGRVTLKRGDYFKTSGCGPWVKQ